MKIIDAIFIGYALFVLWYCVLMTVDMFSGYLSVRKYILIVVILNATVAVAWNIIRL